MPFSMHHIQHLKGPVEAGEVPMERINDAARRVLRQQIRFAQGRDPQDYPLDVVGCAAHRQIAREAAEKAIVLLKNDNNVLPLQGIKKLAVIGRLADTSNTGDGGSSNTYLDYVITPLQGLREALNVNVEIVFDDGSDPARATRTAQSANAAILVVDYTCLDEGEYVAADTMVELAKYYPKPSEEQQAIADAMMANMSQVTTFPPGGDRHQLTLSAMVFPHNSWYWRCNK